MTPKQLTSGRYSDGNVHLGQRQSRTIYFVSDHRDEPYYELPARRIIYLDSGVRRASRRKLTSFDMGAGALLGQSRRQAGRLLCIDQQTGALVLATGSMGDGSQRLMRSRETSPTTFDWDVGAGVGGDNAAPRGGGGNPPVWSRRWPDDLCGLCERR